MRRVPVSSLPASFGRKPNLSEEPPVWFQYCHSDLDGNDDDEDGGNDGNDDDDDEYANYLLGADNLNREGKDHHEDPLGPDASHQPASESESSCFGDLLILILISFNITNIIKLV